MDIGLIYREKLSCLGSGDIICTSNSVKGWSFTYLAAVTLKGSDCSHSQEKTEDEAEAGWGEERRPV